MKLSVGIWLAAVMLLAACGGGGASSGGTVPAPVVTTAPTAPPSATPQPTMAATPSPLPSAPASPATLTLSWTSSVLAAGVPPQSGAINLFGVGQTATLLATEPGYTGVFSVSVTACASITVSPIAGSPASFLVTANNVAGACKIVIGDASGQAASIQAIVTLTGGSIQ